MVNDSKNQTIYCRIFPKRGPITSDSISIAAGGHCVKQTLIDQHGFELPVRHSYSLKHSMVHGGGKNTGHPWR